MRKFDHNYSLREIKFLKFLKKFTDSTFGTILHAYFTVT